ncbi:hypothetical protein I350_02675 [Cryptococcus amylolentus CBS 6273]|uniref:Mediator of RNA polymerase II transcription subunit 14 n=1 Tax=Cryptococcus amylolentus CBS 6273 TaxID=1296118 RepID=A0A1E3K820_9TREE|nr:hypothetical protein I350_02675 [Cryptococcus amylolentus CBS 6273]
MASSHNPQLGSDPYFAYPTPAPEQVESELPPYFQDENVPLGLVLDRFAKKSNHDLRVLLGETLPRLPAKDRPKPIIEYAKTTRQALVKYLAVLRWKTSVDIPAHLTAAPPLTTSVGPTSFPTPHSNGDMELSPSYQGLNKPKSDEEKKSLQGKVTDAKRIAHFLEHQNQQHELAIEHAKHVVNVVEGLRERNPDILTALSLQTNGTYNRLPTSVVDPYLPKQPLTNSSILKVLRKLNQQIRYRLRCLDHVPSDLIIEGIKDGRVYVRGSHWRAELTVVGFGDASRWWLTGLAWGWKAKDRGIDDPGGMPGDSKQNRRFTGDELQGILDLVNAEVLVPRDVSLGEVDQNFQSDIEPSSKASVDAPLSRLYNIIEHLSLNYQLETLYSQAVDLSQGRWRGQLLPEIDRIAKTLRLRYWIRQRRHGPDSSRRLHSQGQKPASAPLIFGGSLLISISESNTLKSPLEDLLNDISLCEAKSCERSLKLELAIKWIVEEGGAGGGMNAGDVMDNLQLQLNPESLTVEDLLSVATRTHAAHLTRAYTVPLYSSARLIVAAPPFFDSSTDSTERPLTFLIPLPSRQTQSRSNLGIGVSSFTGLLEIVDEGAGLDGARKDRARTSSNNVNDNKSSLSDEVWRLSVAAVMDNMETQLRQLGYHPTRHIPLRLKELVKANLHPLSTLFLALPASPYHYFVTQIQHPMGPAMGINFQIIKLVPSSSDSGIGTKWDIGDQTSVSLEKLRARRKIDAAETQITPPLYEVDNHDLKELCILSNALVAQNIVEQQLKDRSIPYTSVFPPPSGPASPKSNSPLAGMIPTLCVDVRDLLRSLGRKGAGAGEAAVDVAFPKVWLQIEGWWDGGFCEVSTIVVLRHQPHMSSADSVNPLVDGADTDGDEAHEARAEGIFFDPLSSIVRFKAKTINQCVPSFLEQWERLSKVIAVAGEVNRLNQKPVLADVKLLSFDLRKASLQYAPNHIASITYSPSNDSYQITFSISIPSSSPPNPPARSNPHTLLASLFSAKLNELTAQSSSAMRQKGEVGYQLCGLLQGTLPILSLSGDLRAQGASGWQLVVLDITRFQFVRDHKYRRYVLLVTLLPDLRHYLIQDGSLFEDFNGVDSYLGFLTPIPDSENLFFSALKTFPNSKTGAAEAPTLVLGLSDKGLYMESSSMVLDGGKAVMCGIAEFGLLMAKILSLIEGSF